MKIPLKLKIGGHAVSVDTSQELPGENGRSDFSKNSIKICKTLPQSQKEATLIHEIFHFLNTTFDDKNLSSFLGHAVVDSLSEQLYQVLKDNKMLR